jgi:hypothetical protein
MRLREACNALFAVEGLAGIDSANDEMTIVARLIAAERLDIDEAAEQRPNVWLSEKAFR